MKNRFQTPSYPPPHTVPNPPPPIIKTEQPKAKPEPSRAFCSCWEHPVDILNNAASIVQFLDEVSPAMVESFGNLGLSEKGINGLAIIYHTLEETIQAAIEAINNMEDKKAVLS